MRANSRIWIPGGEGEENCNLLEIHTFRLVRSGNGLLLLPPRALLVTAGFTSKYTSKIRGALKDLELQADLVHETTSGALCGEQWAPIQV